MVRFRLHKVGMTADIEKAFLNISIAPEHRDFLRFLWVDDPFAETPIIKHLRFNRVVFGLTSSPFILNATIRNHMSKYLDHEPELANEVLTSLYVDDYVSGSTDPISAFSLSENIKAKLSEGGFNMRKWMTNSPELAELWNQSKEFPEINLVSDNQGIIEEDQSYIHHQIPGRGDETSPRVLGQIWNTNQDNLEYDFTKPLLNLNMDTATKRTVLSVTTKFYDPVGLISPVLLMFKLLFQKLCKDNSDWDSQLEVELFSECRSLIADLKEVRNMSVRRCYCPRLYDENVTVHKSGETHCSLIASKTRVSPTANYTIPRLELLACLISAKLAHSVLQALNGTLVIHDVIYWTDSTVALSWIQGVTKEYKQFVQNRVSEIRRLTSIESWRHCSTDQNPADIASRGARASELKNNHMWWNGPNFLSESRDNWPIPLNQGDLRIEIDEELKSTKTSFNTTAMTTGTCDKPRLSKLIEVSKYSSVLRLVRVTAYVLRFVNNIKSHLKHCDSLSEELSVDEINSAERLWIKEIQEEIELNPKFRQIENSLDLRRDDNGILRCHGRLDNAPLPYDAKFPILLPSDHHFTYLVIQLCHRAVMHNGVQETLSQVRSRFWIIKGRQVVKRILSKCTVCRRMEGKSCANPESPSLPQFRLSDDFAFTNIGVDYAGPLYVKDIYSNSATMNKTYIALYTCASSRAVHLDLVPDASSKAIIRSLQRFIARRGIPSQVLSDNSKTFKNRDVRNFASSQGIIWKFNVPKSPWWGGFFERLVRSAKRCLKKTLGNARLSYEELLTTVVQVEGVLNSRPLTYINEDGGEPLTPSHLVLGKRLLSKVSYSSTINHSADKTGTLRREKYLNTVLSRFWNRWRNDYLIQIREHHRPNRKQGPTMKDGSIVCIKEDSVPRQSWKLGCVQSLLPGRDGKERAAVVRVQQKQGTITNLYRPLQKLFPIELESSESSSSEKKQEVPITFVARGLQENIH